MIKDCILRNIQRIALCPRNCESGMKKLGVIHCEVDVHVQIWSTILYGGVLSEVSLDGGCCM